MKIDTGQPPKNVEWTVPDKIRVRQRRKLRKWWLNLHRWTALSIGFLFVLLGLTGSLNVFRWEIDALLNPELQIAEPKGQYRSLEEIMHAAQAARPDCEGNWSLQWPENASSLALVRCRETQSERWFSLKMIWVDPYTAAVMSNRTFGDFLTTWIYDLHWALLLDETGHTIVGFLGVMLMITLGTGLYLWWPGPRGLRKALRIKLNASPERLIFDLHKSFGLCALPVLFVLAFSGVYLIFPEYVKPLVNLFSPMTPEPVEMVSVPTPGWVPIGIDEAVAIARGVFPDGEPKWITIPNGQTGVYKVTMRRVDAGIAEWLNKTYGASGVAIDQYSGDVLAVKDSTRRSIGDLFLDVQWALHYGEALGLPGRILWCIAGLLLLLLYITGIVRWMQKRRARKRRTNA